MNLLETYTPSVYKTISHLAPGIEPWQLTDSLLEILRQLSPELVQGYERQGDVFIHRTATVHPTAILQDIVIVGSGVNIEAGAVLANHYNERQDKTIWVLAKGQ